ncbi:DUF5686 family protein [Cytophaga aurantiaca]|uniref:DUF5686 family protein n=1 Tax=Cytophaga aurantiaca TaxID=29530 RepID=UPI001FDEE1D3|nr:DUF5686 family protein [Cytophaga aurantiaca]
MVIFFSLNRIKIVLTTFFFASFISFSFSQTITIKGYILDSTTTDTIPFVTVYVQGTGYGTTSDDAGFYELEVPTSTDSIWVTTMGYVTKVIALPKKKTVLQLNISISEDLSIPEIVIVPRENPAYRILREVVKHKNDNDKRKLSGYEYETYNRTSIFVNNINQELREKKIMQQVAGVLDSMKSLKDSDGKPMIPVLMSETVSSYYYRTNPNASKEVIKAVKVEGIGMDDGSLLSQVLGSTFQEYNFYENYMHILDKDFISPISDSWHIFYDYKLVDSLYMDSLWCYKINFTPKQPKDLAFYGTMWITDSTFALKQIEGEIHKEANLNFIDKIQIKQNLIPFEGGAWLPETTHIYLDLEDIGKLPSMVATFYSNIQDPVVNKPKEKTFFDQRIEVLEDAQEKSPEFWSKVYEDTTRKTDPEVYKMIDTIRNLPIIKSYVEVLDIAINGYKNLGKIEVGSYLSFYSYNNIEGHKFQLGIRTNTDFSKKVILKGFVGYGTRDDRLKYGGSATFILSRKPWTQAGAYYKYDIDQIGAPSEKLANNNLFLAFTRWGTLRGPYYSRQVGVFFERDLTKNIMPKVIFRHMWFDPIYNFAAYESEPTASYTPGLVEQFQTTELILLLKLSYDELFLQNGNERISLGGKKWPIAHIQYTAGLKGVLGGDYNYHKLQLTLNQSIRFGIVGRTNYEFTIGKIYKPVPYPLIENHIGNQTLFYTTAAFNLMNFFEYSSDQYASIRLKHDLDGLISNRIPVMKQLKWRFFLTTNVLFGSMSEQNKNLLAPINSAGEPTVKISSLDPTRPYVEVGYGIDNIFKCARIDFIHRVTYRDVPDISKFGIKISFRFII